MYGKAHGSSLRGYLIFSQLQGRSLEARGVNGKAVLTVG
jgi:hypothetical protein